MENSIKIEIMKGLVELSFTTAFYNLHHNPPVDGGFADFQKSRHFLYELRKIMTIENIEKTTITYFSPYNGEKYLHVFPLKESEIKQHNEKYLCSISLLDFYTKSGDYKKIEHELIL